MKRAALALGLLLVPAANAYAFNAELKEGARIGVLRMDRDREWHRAERNVANAVLHYLGAELTARGFEAFDSRQTYDQLVREGRPEADYYVEIVAGNFDSDPYGGVAVGTRNVGVEIGVVVSRVAAQVRLYDGHSLELIDTYELQRSKTAVVPTAIGVGGRHIAAWIAVPFVQYAQYRAAARGVARDAASAIAGEMPDDEEEAENEERE